MDLRCVAWFVLSRYASTNKSTQLRPLSGALWLKKMKVTSVFEKLFSTEFDEEFGSTLEQQDLLDEIVEGYYSDEDICELLFSKAPQNYEPDKLAALFSMLFWQTPDNGSRMFETLERWAVSGDLRKVKVTRSNQLEVVLDNVPKPAKP